MQCFSTSSITASTPHSSTGLTGEIEVQVDAFCGKVQLMVADDATVIDDGAAILGKRAVYGEQDGRNGPVIRLTGTVKLGNLKVFRV